MKILVISLAGIGDTLIATPLVRALRASYPEATIDAFVLWPGSKDLLDGNPNLDTIHQFNFFKAGPVRSLPFLFRLRRHHYDISMNTHPQSRLAYRIVARFVGAPMRLSHRYDNSTWLDRWLVNRTVPQDYAIHGVANNLQLLTLLTKQSPPAPSDFEIFLSPAESAWAQEYLSAQGLASRQRLGVHVGSGGTKNLALKRWPLDCYISLIQRLVASHPRLSVLLFGGPEEQQAHQQILQATPATKAILTPPTKNLRQAAALMPHCHAFLSVDTALMHLAAAMKVPNQIVIEAPTLNATNLPYRNPYRLIENPAVHGRNLEYYRYDGAPIRGTDKELIQCMRAVSVDAVYAAVVEALSSTVSERTQRT